MIWNYFSTSQRSNSSGMTRLWAQGLSEEGFKMHVTYVHEVKEGSGQTDF